MKFKVALTIFAVLFTTASLGKDKVTLEETITVEANSSIHFEVPVGSLDIATYDGDEIIVKVEVEEADNDWFSSPDLSEAQIAIDNSGDKVHLEIDMEDVVQKWKVKIPQDASLDIDLGVGGIEIEDFAQDASIDVGVGEIDITLSSDNYREIELGAGVGGVDLDGFKNIDRERAMVSENIEWRGKGDHDLNIEVGVGDIEVSN